MHKQELDKNYLNWETNFKKKVLINTNYVLGIMAVLECLSKYQERGTIFCWENTAYFIFLPWSFLGQKLSFKHFSYNTGAFMNALLHHIGVYVTLFTKNNYVAILVSYINHFYMRSVFIESRKLALLDDGIITLFLGLTIHKMGAELFDENNKCIWDYDTFKADIADTISRFIMIYATLYLSDHFAKKKILCLKELADEIENKSNEKERFFACVSHELRNPLSSLLACVEILPTSTPAKRAELLSAARTCGDTLLNLIGNILDVSKIKDKKMELYPMDADISELMMKVVMMHKIKAQNKRLYFDLISDPTIPPCVKIDSSKFTQALTNLISNSIKFTENGSVIIKMSWIPVTGDNYTNDDFVEAMRIAEEISNREEVLNIVEEIPAGNIPERELDKKLRYYLGKPQKIANPTAVSHGPWINYSPTPSMLSMREIPMNRRKVETKEQGILKIEIIDSGIGITQQNIEKLFQPFVQADKSISRNFGETGQGLWIAKSIIEMMGGHIKIESEVDQGSNFMIIVPLFSGNEEVVLKEREIDLESLNNVYKGLKVLYVEDITENQMIMIQVLTQLGFEIDLANNGSEGLIKFKRKGMAYYDIILTDLRMPNMSGQTMIMKIREFEEIFLNESSRIPIIVLTGDPSENERKNCLNILKVNSFLNKPVSIHQFTVELRKIFKNSDNEEEIKRAETGRKKVILIIEDDTLLNNLVKHFLSDYEVIQAYSVKDGMEQVMDSYAHIFAVCLDGNLPDGTGLDFLQLCRKFERKVKGIPSDKFVKVISTSGDSIKMQKELYIYINL